MAAPRRAIVLALIFRSTPLAENAATASAVTGDGARSECSLRAPHAALSPNSCTSAERHESKKGGQYSRVKPALHWDVDRLRGDARRHLRLEAVKPAGKRRRAAARVRL